MSQKFVCIIFIKVCILEKALLNVLHAHCKRAARLCGVEGWFGANTQIRRMKADLWSVFEVIVPFEFILSFS